MAALGGKLTLAAISRAPGVFVYFQPSWRTGGHVTAFNHAAAFAGYLDPSFDPRNPGA
jgi:hypothetical protein